MRAGAFWGSGAIRVNALWQDGGIAGRDYTARESKSIAPSIAFGLNTPTRVSLSGQVMRQDNLADYGLPAAAAPDGPLAAGGIVAATPVDQENYYGSPDYDYDKVSQDNVMLRAEHDFSPAVTLRNQTRYNRRARRGHHEHRQSGGLQPGDESRHPEPPGELPARTRSSRTRPA